MDEERRPEIDTIFDALESVEQPSTKLAVSRERVEQDQGRNAPLCLAQGSSSVLPLVAQSIEVGTTSQRSGSS
jgi:hypothetical protein